ncbi:serine protease 27-like [Labeo rohita]|uniref:serine protease 27-like n=1 Tax=Labeo rohita TaxID=84645 RepID=UPI0021E22FBF|nr:serine protease 27-like [Labeo rohita]
MKLNTIFCVAGAILLNIAGCLGQSDVCGQAPLNTKIIGGQNATAGSWPWQASIHELSTGRFYFTGTLINKDCSYQCGFIIVKIKLTCIYSINVSDIVIYLGRLTQNGSNPHEISRTVTQIKHPNYNSLGYSLALFQLSSSVNFTDYIRPVCLAAAGSEFPAGTESWVTGWGSISAEGEKHLLQLPDILQEVENPVVDNTECNNSYGGIITDKLICAGFLNEGGKAPCRRDFGSPLLIRQGSVWIQFGVAVFSRGCGLPGYPAVYIRVSEYQDWISNYTSSNEPGFVSYPIVPVIVSVLDGGSVNVLSFSIALTFSIIPLILHFF